MSTEPSKHPTKKGDTPARKKAIGPFTAVGIDRNVHRQLDKNARALGVTKSEFATAAVAYFTERELNPISDRVREGMQIQNRVNDRADRLEQQIAALGNRLFGFLQTSEKTVMSFLVEQEKTLLAPLIEHVLRAGIDAYFGRQLSEQILLKQHDRLGEYDAKHAKQNEKVTTELTKRLLEFKPTPIRRKQDSPPVSSTTGSSTTPSTSVAVTPNTPPPSDTY